MLCPWRRHTQTIIALQEKKFITQSKNSAAKKNKTWLSFEKPSRILFLFLVSSSSDNLEELCCGPDLCLDANRMNVEQTHRLPSTNLFERRIIQGHAIFHIGTHVVGWTNLNSLNHFRRHVTRYKSNNESTIASVFFLWYFDSVVGWKKKTSGWIEKANLSSIQLNSH